VIHGRLSDGLSLRVYVEKVLLPTLRPGDIVIMDNLGCHKAKAVRQLIRFVSPEEWHRVLQMPLSSAIDCE